MREPGLHLGTVFTGSNLRPTYANCNRRCYIFLLINVRLLRKPKMKKPNLCQMLNPRNKTDLAVIYFSDYPRCEILYSYTRITAPCYKTPFWSISPVAVIKHNYVQEVGLVRYTGTTSSQKFHVFINCASLHQQVPTCGLSSKGERVKVLYYCLGCLGFPSNKVKVWIGETKGSNAAGTRTLWG